MADQRPVIMWFRRDLRLADNAALSAACRDGRPVIPLFISDAIEQGCGAAARFRLGLSLGDLEESLEARGLRLILRRGEALAVLREVIAQTEAEAVHWSRLYEPETKARDAEVKEALSGEGIEARSFAGHLLFEPWEVSTKTGGYYKVFTPLWKALRERDPGAPVGVPEMRGPEAWPESDALEDWGMAAEMARGAAIVGAHQGVGEVTAQSRLAGFVEEVMAGYPETRDQPGVAGTSRLAENLTYGEISPRQIWAAGMVAREAGNAGAESFLRQLVWRDFAHHLMHHTPHILTRNWREGWDQFPWNRDEEHPHVVAWKQGRTGVPFVDAAMREAYVTGQMHNRGRMIVGSYLTKHLMCHWEIGMRWFAEILTDWDRASNAMGWQWVAGSGPDAALYFRVFNPVSQLQKFDPEGRYKAAWIAEGAAVPSETALSYFNAIPKAWELSARDAYPQPIVELADGRNRALAAYSAR